MVVFGGWGWVRVGTGVSGCGSGSSPGSGFGSGFVFVFGVGVCLGTVPLTRDLDRGMCRFRSLLHSRFKASEFDSNFSIPDSKLPT